MSGKKDNGHSRGKPPGPPKLYLVDASSYAYRAYHATAHQGLSTRGGAPTGAVLVFVNMILKLIRDEHPTHLAVVWDAKGKNFRHQLYPEYKATRAVMPEDLRPQMDYMRRIVTAFNFPALEREGYEADDLIGALAKQAGASGLETVIVSGDKDLTQLVTDRVTLLDTLKDTRADAAGVKERMGVAPEQVIDLLALWGDSSDNVPGVPKVGEKTAKKLMQEYGSLDAVLAHAAEIKGKVGENLVAFADQARLSKQLVTIAVDLPLDFNLDDYQLREPDRAALHALFSELEFNRLMQEFAADRPQLSDDAYRLIMNAAELKVFVKQAEKAGALAIDTETSSLAPTQADLIGISMAIVPGEAVYVPVAHTGFDAAGQLSREEALEILRPILASEMVGKIGQNMKYDYAVLCRAGAPMENMAFDTMVASYLVNPRRRTHGLDELAMEFLGHKTIKYEDVAGAGKKQVPFASVAVDAALRYSGEDADVALRLKDRLEPELAASELRDLFDRIEMPLVPVLARMEMTGVKIDVGRLGRLSEQFEKEIAGYREKIFALAGREFTIDSPKQLGEVLFDELKLPTGKKTKTGWSTNQEVLDHLAEEYELPGLILEYRSLAKLKSTYTDALAKLVSPADGRLHTSYNQTVTSTGRLSSSDPNLQNIPVRQAIGRQIRESFIGEGENLILSADYSQIELRIMAHIADEPALLDAFRHGEDVHRRTAAEVFGVMPELVTDEQRRHAKVINFGILYGMSAHGLTRQLGVGRKEAQAYIDAYFARYPRVKAYMQAIVETARRQGYVTTLNGRRLPVPEIGSSNFNVRQGAERETINAPLQGSAADIIKIAMIRIDRALREKNFRAKMIMQVHDELVFELPPAELDRLRDLVKQEMESAAELKVKLIVDVSHGRNWAQAH
jgi:DNA polymerase I